jgi:hypothetical protein
MLADAIALFGAGIASFLAPCVIPLVPAYLGMITGEAADSDRRVRAPASVVAGDGDSHGDSDGAGAMVEPEPDGATAAGTATRADAEVEAGRAVVSGSHRTRDGIQKIRQTTCA